MTYWASKNSDLHLYHGLVPDTRVGTTFGHEFTGIVEEVGPSVQNLKKGDKVLVPFNIFCGTCFFCRRELFSNCHNTNPEATAVGAIFGYSHTAGGYDGGQAELVRVPFADIGPTILPADMDEDDAVLFWPCATLGLCIALLDAYLTLRTDIFKAKQIQKNQ